MDRARKRAAVPFFMFASFMLLQFVILRIGNQAGRGFLTDRQQELVYCFLQCAAIPGFLTHAAVYRFLKNGGGYAATAIMSAILCGVGGEVLLMIRSDSLTCLIATGITVFLMGFTGGAVFLRLAFLGRNAAGLGLPLGGGYAAAVALQFFLQLQWTVKPALAALLALSCGTIVYVLKQSDEPEIVSGPVNRRVGAKDAAIACFVTFALLVFSGFYNRYIHHLQIASGYTVYNVYTWPRLMMIPTVLLFGWLGDFKNGRYLPLSTLCVSVIAMLNTALLGRETYLLNMCLFYVSLSAVVVFYHLTFLRLSQGASNPALWACMGRVLDSATVVFTFLIRLSERSQSTVLLIEIAALSVAVVLMALGGAFDLSKKGPAALPVVTPQQKPAVDPFELMRVRYGLTPGELRVFRELVTTEDKQNAIGDRLSIKVRTVQANVTAIYRKTGVSTRAGLVQLFQGLAD